MDSKSPYNQFFRAARDAKKATVPKSSDAAAIRERVQLKRNKRRSSRPAFPVMPVTVFVASISVCGWALWNVDRLERWLGRVSVGVFSEAKAETKAAKSTETKEPNKEKSAAEAKDAQPETGIPKKGLNEEQVALFSKLEDRKKQLDEREAELANLDKELQKQKGELAQRLRELEDLRKKITGQLKDRIETDQEKVGLLVEVYSGMKAQSAAKILEQINEDLAVEILGKMKKKSSSEILSLVAPDKAQKLSERLAGYKRN